MDTMKTITVETLVDAPLEELWRYFTEPEHIMKWNNASPDWHTPKAENDLRAGGAFDYRMEARDGSEGFDFAGKYIEVIPHRRIVYEIGDGRNVEVEFVQETEGVRIRETFEAEGEHPPEMQRAGWQAILDNFKAYAEVG